jgi:hypothetical protein
MHDAVPWGDRLCSEIHVRPSQGRQFLGRRIRRTARSGEGDTRCSERCGRRNGHISTRQRLIANTNWPNRASRLWGWKQANSSIIRGTCAPDPSVCLVSRSGESVEIAPQIGQIAKRTSGMANEPNSTLGKNVDLMLTIGYRRDGRHSKDIRQRYCCSCCLRAPLAATSAAVKSFNES